MRTTRKILLISAMVLLCGVAAAQQPTTIEQCYAAAKANYPLAQRYELIEKSKNYSLRNAGMAYVPQVGLSAKATYQTEVTTIPVPMIEPMAKDQYQVALEVNQTIWDGGAARAQKRGIGASSDLETKQLDVDLYALNDRVNNLFFGILTLDEQLKLNDLLDAELGRNLSNVESYLQGGIATATDVDAVRVEILSNRQKRAAIVAARSAYVAMLGSLVGFPIEQLERPQKPSKGDLDDNFRPELSLFQAQIAASDTKRLSITAQNMPRLGAFVQGAYGSPGLDMFKSGFNPYAIAGVRLSWNFGGFYTAKNEKAKIEIEKNSILSARSAFVFNTNLDIKQSSGEVARIEAQMVDDEQIIGLRGNIKRAAEAKVAQGTMTVTDMLREVTAENAAMQQKALKEVELLMTLYNIKYKTNN